MPKLPALPWIRAGIAQGLSGREAYRRYFATVTSLSSETGETWHGVRTYTFQQQYSQIRQARGNVPAAMAAPKTEPGGGLPVPPRQVTRPGGYLNWGVGFVRVIGTSAVDMTIHAIRSQQLLTPQEVENRIRQMIEDSAQESHGTFENHTIEGVVFTGVQELVPIE